MTTNFSTIDDDLLAKCVSCGLCLPHCPTYRVTGLDSHSPRGRIALVAAVRNGQLELDSGIRESLDSCVQCMGCLPACPSGVRYDEIIHPVVDELTRISRLRRVGRSVLLSPLGRPRTLRALTRIAAVAQRLGLLPRRVAAPKLRVSTRRRRQSPETNLRPSIELFTGCVMGAWFNDVHKASIQVLSSLGYEVSMTDESLCCGALHSHAGLVRRAGKLLRRVSRQADSSPLIINSAGCGAHLATNGVAVADIMSFLEDHIDELRSTGSNAARESVLVHDACHSRNVLGTHLAAQRVLSLWYDVVPIPDDGLCCGAGGAYSMVHPSEARAIVERKFAAVISGGLDGIRLLSSGNPGCTGHMAAHLPPKLAQLEIMHPIELVARKIRES